MSRRDPLHLKLLRGVPCELEDFSREVFQDGGGVHSSGGADAALGAGPELEVAVDPPNRELQGRGESR